MQTRIALASFEGGLGQQHRAFLQTEKMACWKRRPQVAFDLCLFGGGVLALTVRVSICFFTQLKLIAPSTCYVRCRRK